MHQGSSFEWAIVIYAAAAVVLLVVGTFRLDEVLARRKRSRVPHLVAGRHFQHPNARLTDPHGGGSASGPASVGHRPQSRPRIMP